MAQKQDKISERLHQIELSELEIDFLLTHMARSLEMSAFPYGNSTDESIERKLCAAYAPPDREPITKYQEPRP